MTSSNPRTMLIMLILMILVSILKQKDVIRCSTIRISNFRSCKILCLGNEICL
jgi:hypothetical protein